MRFTRSISAVAALLVAPLLALGATSVSAATIPPPVGAGWQLNGAAALAGSTLTLTGTQNSTAGTAIWPTPLVGAGVRASFQAYLGGGAGGADGLTFMLADAATTTSAAVGGAGGGLGFAGIAGVAVTLDTWQNPGDPSNNFVAVATSPAPHVLSYVATNARIPSLRGRLHTVGVSTTNDHITVTLDGTTVLNARVDLPPSVLVGFTAATGGSTDTHSVRNVSIAAAPTATVPPAPVTLNSIERVQYSMAGPHEGSMAGVPAMWSWGSHPEVDNPMNNGFQAVTSWGQIYAVSSVTEPAQSTVRVEIKNMETYVWSLSQQKWIRVQATVTVGGAHYLNDYGSSSGQGNYSVATDARTEPDGGTSVSMVTGYNFHLWPDSARASIPASDIGGEYTTYQARLIGPNAGSAQFLANAGGDWWTTPTAPYNFSGPTGNNNQIGQGRFMALSTTWSAIDFFSGGTYGTGVAGAMTNAQLAASNPPVDAMGLP